MTEPCVLGYLRQAEQAVIGEARGDASLQVYSAWQASPASSTVGVLLPHLVRELVAMWLCDGHPKASVLGHVQAPRRTGTGCPFMTGACSAEYKKGLAVPEDKRRSHRTPTSSVPVLWGLGRGHGLRTQYLIARCGIGLGALLPEDAQNGVLLGERCSTVSVMRSVRSEPLPQDAQV